MCTLHIASLFLFPLTSLAAANCHSFLNHTIPKNVNIHSTTVLNTTYYDVGALNVSGALNEVAFCEVRASVAYSMNGSLNFALWLPDAGSYSSRFMAVGNGGFAGSIAFEDMMFELNNGMGLAVAGGDAGHRASDNGGSTGAPGIYTPFLHNPDQVQAWLHDAISIFTPAAKAITEAFYSRDLEYSYYRGCSTGGAQGFSLAEFHPDLFNGVIAGGPANWFTGIMLSFLHGAQQTNSSRTFLSQDLLDFVQTSVIKACDLNDGVEDELIENPLSCAFDISSLGCANSTSEDALCLTPDQLAAMESIYRGPYSSDAPDVKIYSGLTLGSEAGWSLPQVSGALSDAFTVPILQNIVYDDLSYDPATFNWGSDVTVLESRAGPLINARSTNLSKFRKNGGKMIVFAGWADPNIAPEGTLEHVQALTEGTLGKGHTIAENDFVKLVMIPGGGHCGANIAKYPSVPAKYDFSPAIAKWVETGSAPLEGIRSWDPVSGEKRSRKLCTWPHIAKYDGKGELDDWNSYFCASDARSVPSPI